LSFYVAKGPTLYSKKFQIKRRVLGAKVNKMSKSEANDRIPINPSIALIPLHEILGRAQEKNMRGTDSTWPQSRLSICASVEMQNLLARRKSARGPAGIYGFWMHTTDGGRSGYLQPGWLAAF
jgi:hypothetical protein